MNKKAIIGLIFLVITVISGAAYTALLQNNNGKVNTASRAETTLEKVMEPVKSAKKEPALKEYSDPSGFKFLYPSTFGLVVEQDETDEDLYSSVKLKSNTGANTINIKVTASNFKKLDDWLRANNIPVSSPSIKRVKLADLDAYQVPLQRQLVTVAYDQSVIFTIIANNQDDAMLLKAYNTVIDNFSFYQPESTTETQAQPAETGGGEAVTEDEEVIE